MSRTPPKPPGIGSRASKLWRALNDEYEFTPPEAALLVEACRCVDRLDQLDDAIREVGPMVAGSTGQPVVNPALTEARGQQAVLHRLIAALQLSEDDVTQVLTARQIGSATANRARWNQSARSGANGA